MLDKYTVEVEYDLVDDTRRVYPCRVTLQVTSSPHFLTPAILPADNESGYVVIRQELFFDWVCAANWLQRMGMQITERVAFIHEQHSNLRRKHLQHMKPDDKILTF